MMTNEKLKERYRRFVDSVGQSANFNLTENHNVIYGPNKYVSVPLCSKYNFIVCMACLNKLLKSEGGCIPRTVAVRIDQSDCSIIVGGYS